jgi:5-methyltetrahydropteroyltriglutamate--homocysteine methyltransferase
MTELVATTPGLYPLPDRAKEDLADLKGHQRADLVDGSEDEDVQAVYESVREELVGDQTAAGLDRVVEGQARWDDMLAHPLAVHPAVETGGIRRYYDNNNFYREVTVTDDLGFSGDVADELSAAGDLLGDEAPLQAVLPGPYSLFDLATDDYYGDDAEFLGALADFLEGEVGAFPDYETLFLLEPSLATAPPGDGLDERASEAVDRVAGATRADVVVHTCWEPLEERVYAHLMDADVEALGFDFVAEQDQTLYNIQEYGTTDAIAAGVVDARNTLVESAETVAERVEWVREAVTTTTFDRVYATANVELFYLPTNKYRAKLSALADGVALADGEVPDSEVEA